MADSELRKMTRGLGPVSYVLGSVCLIAGSLVLYSIPLAQADIAWQVDLVCLAMIVLGIVLVFGRSGLIVAPRAGTLTRWWGLMVPFVRRVYPLAAITHLRLVKHVYNTSKGQRVAFRVMMKGRDIGDVELTHSIDYDRARQQAEAFAKFLRLDLHDEASGETIIREARFLDESLRERHRRLGIPAPLPQPPEGAVARLRHDDAGAATVIEIPATGFRASYVLALLIVMSGPLLFFLALAAVELPQALQTPGVRPAFILMFSVFFGLVLLPVALIVLDLSTSREIITVSPSGIEVELRSLIRRNRVRRAAAEIEEIVAPADLRRNAASAGQVSRVVNRFAGARAVLIRTDKGTTGVGRWVSAAEQEWLRAMLVHGLVGDLGSRGVFAPAFGAARSSPSPAIRPPAAESREGGVKWIAWTIAAGALIVLANQFGILHLGWPTDRTKQASDADAPGDLGSPRYELTPGPGSGYLRVYGRGVDAQPSGRDLRIAISEVRLAATSREAETKFWSLTVSVHRRIEGEWKLVGTGARDGFRSELPSGGTFTYPGPRVFVVEGAADTCMREPCYFRVHVIGQVGSRRPGWDVTELVQLKLPQSGKK